MVPEVNALVLPTHTLIAMSRSINMYTDGEVVIMLAFHQSMYFVHQMREQAAGVRFPFSVCRVAFIFLSSSQCYPCYRLVIYHPTPHSPSGSLLTELVIAAFLFRRTPIHGSYKDYNILGLGLPNSQLVILGKILTS
jgi:hypothetical protein